MSRVPVIKGKTRHLGVVTDEFMETGLSDKQKEKQDAAVTVARYIRKLRRNLGVSSLRPALALFREKHQADLLPPPVMNAIVTLHTKHRDKCPSAATLRRLHEGYREYIHNDTNALAPKHQGSQRKNYDWESRALALYNVPQKRPISSVARQLRQEGFASASRSRVERYIKTLHPQYGAKGVGRLGVRAYAATQRKYVVRSTDNLPPGACYQGDGHTLDIYLQHPAGSKPWRAELTLWIDVASRYVPGYYVSEAESGYSTVAAIHRAIVNEDHIPSYLHIDNGSGYKNKMMSTENLGVYEQLGISVMNSIPYNAKAKGQVERFFGTMERDLNKRFDSYCGHDMAPEAIQKLLKDVERGKKQLPTLAQWLDAFEEWLQDYHHRPHRGLDGRAPIQVWSTMERFPLSEVQRYAFWTRTPRRVTREMIQLDKRLYSAPELVAYNQQDVVVEYNPGDDTEVRILLPGGRWICDAQLVQKADYLPASRLDEAKQKRLVTQIKRLERHAEEKRDRAGLTYTQEHLLEDEARLMPAEEPLLLDAPIDEEALLNNLLHPSDFDEAPARQPTVNLFETD